MTESPINRPSATEPDWSREARSSMFAWEPPRQLLHSIRSYQKAKQRGGALNKLRAAVAILRHRFWSIIAATDVPINCQFEGGMKFVHSNGIVIHPSSTFGPNCALFQQVTVVGDVKVGGGVEIGAGAKIVRGVSIGDHARIGANAVVISDVPAGATAVGIPARIIER